MTETVSTAEAAIVGLLSDPATRANPYPAYDAIRAAGGVFHSELGFWFVSSYSEAARLMRHPDLPRQHGESWTRRGEMSNSLGRPWFEQQARFMIFIDPPDHTRIRGLVSRAFTPRYLQRLKPQVVERVEQLVDEFAERGGGDLIDSLALSLPMMVICDMLGVPAGDRDNFRRWTIDIAATLEPFPSPEVQDAADKASVAFEDYFKDLVRKRRSTPRDDLLSRMIEAEEAGERLNEQELIATAILLLAAGFETTTNLIGNGTLALLGSRDQWDALVADPSLAARAVEEILRYDSPVQMATPRVPTTRPLRPAPRGTTPFAARMATTSSRAVEATTRLKGGAAKTSSVARGVTTFFWAATATITSTERQETTRAFGQAGKDEIVASTSNDNQYGGPGDDALYDNIGRDNLYLGAGFDYGSVTDATADDSVDGGPDVDECPSDASDDKVNCES